MENTEGVSLTYHLWSKRLLEGCSKKLFYSFCECSIPHTNNLR